MPLIKNKAPQTKINLRGKEISSIVFKEIQDYCQWAEIDDIGLFLEEASIHVFKSDKDWKSFKKSQEHLSVNIPKEQMQS